MATALPFSTIPFPLGSTTVDAGAPASIVNHFTDLGGIRVQSLMVKAHPNNSGVVFVLNSSAAADTVNFLNVLDILAAGQSIVFSGKYGNQIDISKVWTDGDTDGDIAIATIQEN